MRRTHAIPGGKSDVGDMEDYDEDEEEFKVDVEDKEIDTKGSYSLQLYFKSLPFIRCGLAADGGYHKMLSGAVVYSDQDNLTH